jgi:FdhE protein
MAGRLLHKLFSSATLPPLEVATALGELERLAKERPELAGSITFLRDILPKLYQEPVVDPILSLTSDHSATKLAGGVPLLRGEDVQLDIQAFHRRWQFICEAVQRHQKDQAGETLAQGLRKGTLDPKALAVELFAGRAQGIHARADALGLDPGMTATVLRLALFPVLAQFSTAFAPLRESVPWKQGYCPTCGSWPLLGEFRGLEQTRFLRCGLCAAAWEFPRLRCAFCGTSDHQVLGYLHVEGEEGKYRAATCDACRGYVKMVSTLGALSGPQLLVTELATMHLDLAALARNYISP